MKLDFKNQDKALYSGKVGQWSAIEVPPLSYLMIDGSGDPNGPDYASVVASIYPLAYALKFAAKAERSDFVVPPLEALWWAEDPTAFVRDERSDWRWTVMLRMPAATTAPSIDLAKENCRAKLAKKNSPAVGNLDDIRLEVLHEGACLQTLHVGPYVEEKPVLAELHERVMPQQSVTFNGPHHEVYLSDPRRAAPEKLKTLLRQPVRPVT